MPRPNERLRAFLIQSLIAHINEQGWTQTEMARRVGVNQGRISELMKGHTTRFGIDSLVNMHVALGIPLTIRVGQAPPFTLA